mgnify:CR=1 FL=1
MKEMEKEFKLTRKQIDFLKEMYPETQISEICDLINGERRLVGKANLTSTDIRDMVFGKQVPYEEYGKKPLAKFRHDILKDLGLETSYGNQRAVRILAYNQMELTPENIAEMKAADEEVQRAFDHLKPAVVRTMIKEGMNPLDMSFEEINTVSVSAFVSLSTML